MPIPEGMLWNEAQLETGDPLQHGMFSLMVLTPEKHVQLVGTAFTVLANNNHAYAVGAAHCMEEIRRIIYPHSIHNTNRAHAPSALPEFLPAPQPVDFSAVFALYIKDGVAYTCKVELAIWDEGTDFCILKIIAPNETDALFEDSFLLDNSMPAPGEKVALIGFSDMQTLLSENKTEEDIIASGIITRKLTLRVGYVEENSDEAILLLKRNTGLVTTVPFFKGMSGGIAARYNTAGAIKPFGIICHSLQDHDLEKTGYDRSVSGRAIVAPIHMEITEDAHGKRHVSIPFEKAGFGTVNIKK